MFNRVVNITGVKSVPIPSFSGPYFPTLRPEKFLLTAKKLTWASTALVFQAMEDR